MAIINIILLLTCANLRVSENISRFILSFETCQNFPDNKVPVIGSTKNYLPHYAYVSKNKNQEFN